MQQSQELPIASNEKINDPIVILVDQILHQKQQDPTADTTALEAQIDLLVYRLYGLSWAEVKLVDPEFEMSEEEYEAVEV